VDLEAGRGAGHPDWLTGFRLPAYAPDLNPVEGARAGMKADLGNLSAAPPDQLAAARQRLGRISATLCLSPDFSARPNSPSNLNRHSNQTPGFQSLYSFSRSGTRYATLTGVTTRAALRRSTPEHWRTKSGVSTGAAQLAPN
jgi:hypothetical protein